MKKTVQLLAFLVTATIVFTSAGYKRGDNFFGTYYFYPIQPNVYDCTTRLYSFYESFFGVKYWALYDLTQFRFVKESDLWPSETISQYITIHGYYNFECREVYLVTE